MIIIIPSSTNDATQAPPHVLFHALPKDFLDRERLRNSPTVYEVPKALGMSITSMRLRLAITSRQVL